MDLITLGMAKSYTDSQRIAYDENTVITWDGNTDGLTSIAPLGFPMYRVSDKLIPPGAVQATTADGRVLPDIAIEGLPGIVLAVEGMIISAKAGEYASEDVVLSIPESGTYFAKDDSSNFAVSASFKTIHPIDPKFLPGVCLPVLELSQETMAGVFASGNASCTAEEHAIIWGAYQALSPLIINGNYNGIAFSGVSNILLDSAYTPYFEANAGALKVMVAFDDKTANIRSVQQ